MSDSNGKRLDYSCECGRRYFSFSQVAVCFSDGRIFSLPDAAVLSCLFCGLKWVARVGYIGGENAKDKGLMSIFGKEAQNMIREIARDACRSREQTDSVSEPLYLANEEL